MEMPIRLHQPVRIQRSRQRAIYLVGAGLWASGAAWLLFHYAFKVKTLFGTAENPLTHWWIIAHGLLAFASIFLFGLLWGQHIVAGWKSGRHRWSGGAVFATLSILVASGYLLYYAGGDDTRAITSLVHWIIGLALPLPFLWHWKIRRRSR